MYICECGNSGKSSRGFWGLLDVALRGVLDGVDLGIGIASLLSSSGGVTALADAIRGCRFSAAERLAGVKTGVKQINEYRYEQANTLKQVLREWRNWQTR